MEQREKLIELIKAAFDSQESDKCRKCDAYDCAKCVSEYVADYLIDNGVVVLPCRCEDCVLHGNCIPEDSMMICGIKDGYCAAGKRKGGDE